MIYLKGAGNYAILEADRQIVEAENKATRLRIAKDTFEEMLVKGEPFPGEEFNFGAFGSARGLMSQDRLLQQSPTIGLCLKRRGIMGLYGQGPDFLGRRLQVVSYCCQYQVVG